MAGVKIFTGKASFRELREGGFYYVDKTSFLVEFLQGSLNTVTLLTRPRRFGKTLTLGMLQEFLDIRNAAPLPMERKNNRALFEGLEIMEYPDICTMWMHQYPVVFLSLKNIEGKSFEEALELLVQEIGFLFSDFKFLLESPKMDLEDRDKFRTLKAEKESRAQLTTSLKFLCRSLEAHYGKQTILLIDEYDVPLNCANQNGYYQEMVDFFRAFLGTALKDNRSLKFSVLSGCLRIAKESIFTGLNNFKCYSISETKFANKIGFTSSEVDELLADAGILDKKPVFQEWYDGYRFGKCEEIYCPWDVLQYVDDLKDDQDKKPDLYWLHTSGNDIVKDFLKKSGSGVQKKFELLLQHGWIESTLQESLTYDRLYDSEENLWTLLYLTGYLTKSTTGEMPSSSGRIRLKIPNKEVYEIYVASVDSWFREIVRSKNRDALIAAFWKGDEKKLGELLSELLIETISFYDYDESFYHAILIGLLSSFDYVVKSNRENGEGRSDLTIEKKEGDCAIIIEVKVAKSRERLASMAEGAIRQIDEKRYSASFGEYKNILHLGIVFFKKSCVVKAVWERKA